MSAVEVNSAQKTEIFGGEPKSAHPKRPLGQAMWRGFKSRCPHCGEGRLFRAFVKPVDKC